jgi:hypothetical protein
MLTIPMAIDYQRREGITAPGVARAGAARDVGMMLLAARATSCSSSSASR